MRCCCTARLGHGCSRFVLFFDLIRHVRISFLGRHGLCGCDRRSSAASAATTTNTTTTTLEWFLGVTFNRFTDPLQFFALIWLHVTFHGRLDFLQCLAFRTHGIIGQNRSQGIHFFRRECPITCIRLCAAFSGVRHFLRGGGRCRRVRSGGFGGMFLFLLLARCVRFGCDIGGIGRRCCRFGRRSSGRSSLQLLLGHFAVLLFFANEFILFLQDF
mmetsp:Transcript_15101/g.30693  ORF Transcript_15101/g.30693 Transcript_15101/m.30693 type:complete len:215 (-) Transcript_15101:610-1254(-)